MSLPPGVGLLKRLPDRIALEIRSSIGNTILGAGKPATPDDTYTVCVGQMLQHLAVANVPILSVQWVLPVGGIASYAVAASAGVLTPVAAGMLSMNPLTFAFSMGGAATVGVYITTAYGVGFVANTFVVTAPQVSYFRSMTQQVYVGDFDAKRLLRFGDPGNPEIPGIVMSAAVVGAQNVSGAVGILQLAINERYGTDTDNRAWQWSLNGQAVLDVGPGGAYVFYQNEVGVLNPGGTAELNISDAPGLELGAPFGFVAVGDGVPIIPETYSSYLMFAPTDPGSVCVPLSVLTWSWEGYSELTDGAWSPAQLPANSVNPSGVATSTFPTWAANTYDGQWATGRVGLAGRKARARS